MSYSTHPFFAIEAVSYPPVKPPWLPPAATAFVIALHAAVAWFSMSAAVHQFQMIDVTLVPFGDPFGSLEGPFDSQGQAAVDEGPPPPEPLEEVDQPDLATPPPMVMSPESQPVPTVKKEIAEPKNSVVKHRGEHAKLWGALASRANHGGSYANDAFAKNLELNH